MNTLIKVSAYGNMGGVGSTPIKERLDAFLPEGADVVDATPEESEIYDQT